ncbi:5-demethoxyubiquinone hydroxylase, mitochondrial [Wickerhamiella sorbophila]|uniref:5-demethoxyubiquinone hydroxylase, mitochondrial n=1 Tax=Wickerhamiella sorbophila TaxID=45607 RepID=A0A2T0FM86_9ASCO|nr:5-demethoxyubiquinone hydroxylase, mitochondrial [Wickerhamiella sorbophila]PRT56089.1 5-demethoxyubiquinone hydroxylase, mitochondrial [Wickerhamiella sorbophila]
MLRQSIKAVNNKSLKPAQRKYLEKVIRVDQAGELGADYIYMGQHFVFKQTLPKLAPLIRHMWDQEIHHHNTFDTIQTEGRIRPSVFTPVWKIAALGLGMGTALLGKEAAMACTEAVETVIGGHYNDQLRRLSKEFPETEEFVQLRKLISEFRDDELEHLETAIENDAKKAVPYMLLTEAIKNGCRGAIFLAERF